MAKIIDNSPLQIREAYEWDLLDRCRKIERALDMLDKISEDLEECFAFLEANDFIVLTSAKIEAELVYISRELNELQEKYNPFKEEN